MLILQIGLGLALLVAGGETLVRGAVSLAARLGISPLLIGLTIVGFGTSTPELVTSLQAAFAGSPGIAMGNVVGSNIANILLILGVAALLSPVLVGRESFRRDGAALGIATLAALAIVLTGDLTRLFGLLLFLGLLAYLFVTYQSERTATDPHADLAAKGGLLGPLVLTIIGIALTVLGARFLVSGAIDLAERAGISDAIIGLTIVAVGTSLPELVTSIMAAIRRQSAIAFGNVIGSNIYNILGILAVTALVHPISVPDQIANFDIWVALAATIALMAMAVTGWRITRREGAMLLIAYGAYLAWLATTAVG
ncbi:MAG: calcium/sodium antiporter [Pseudomonadota bacterium]